MTESAFPFAAPEGAAVDAPAEDFSSEDRNRRLLLLVGGAAGVLVLMVAAYFLFLKSDSAEELAGPVVPARTLPAAGAEKDKASPAKKAVPRTFDDVVTRDPFIPLVKEPVAEVTDPAAGAVTGGAASGEGAATGATQTSVSSGRQKETGIRLMNVHTEKGVTYAKTWVANKVYDVKVGETFAEFFMVLSANGKTVTYIEGDETFTLTEGQTIVR